ncbi:MAG: tRNA (adenosine(37)-N6)-threonylcarbamoyltransferase complex ATPase subunit type 1 TsaE [Firmicutes bacterium]|nr:tRNA (adenosine(37)-N6)-threonylcarbamoyltransferase complex ATPase subunit type 1 TsaE [Bacillota bacterium]
MKTIITNSPQETETAGAELAKSLTGGNVVALSGELGAGKTQFVKGIAKGLGISKTVTSPTFTIMNIYDSDDILLYHFDLYRLNSFDEAQEAGLVEYIGAPEAVSVVEWYNQVPGVVDNNAVRIHITKLDDNRREITIGG